MNKELISRVSVPSRLVDLLWTDDEFFREVSGNKKANLQNKFPRCDQWCDEDGFHMAFALAGYSPRDISVEVCNGNVSISGVGQKVAEDKNLDEATAEHSHDEEELEYSAPTPQLIVQRGVIVRGIARRSFRVRYLINPAFNPDAATAFMKNGLLEIVMPRSESFGLKTIDIMER